MRTPYGGMPTPILSADLPGERRGPRSLGDVRNELVVGVGQHGIWLPQEHQGNVTAFRIKEAIMWTSRSQEQPRLAPSAVPARPNGHRPRQITVLVSDALRLVAARSPSPTVPSSSGHKDRVVLPLPEARGHERKE
jgi:hypothetical protein